MEDTRERIVSALADGSVSAAGLADRMGVSHARIEDHVEGLREAGFEIEDTADGYELVDVSEYGADSVAFGLEAPFDVEYHDEIGSTNDRARELAADGAADVVVVADRQSGGRGRRDREWSSPSGGVWLTVVRRPDAIPERAPLFTLAGAVAVARAARAEGVEAEIKWPNDVQVEGHKLAGVLTESATEGDRVEWLAVGIGVNANVDPADLPGDRDAISVQEVLGSPVDRRTFTQRLLEEFHGLTSDLDAVLPAWRDLSVTLDREVRVETPDATITGRAVDVTDSGSLVVETDDGRVTVATGECDHLRPAGP